MVKLVLTKAQAEIVANALHTRLQFLKTNMDIPEAKTILADYDMLVSSLKKEIDSPEAEVLEDVKI